MTQEEKAKRYDEAIEKAKVFKEHLLEIDDKDYADEMDYIFPELKESEDERIRKEIIEVFKSLGEGKIPTNLNYANIFTWLEEQEQHKKFRDSIQVGDKVTKNEDGVLVNLSQLKRVAKNYKKQGEHKPADKTEPKFKYGDRVRNKKSGLEQTLGSCIEDVYEGAFPFRIKDQDDWELVEQKPVKWSEEDEYNYGIITTQLTGGSVSLQDSIGAIKWFKSLKDRVQPKQEWNEEDENNILFLTSIIEECFKDKEKITLCSDTVCAHFTKENVIDRLKSLRPQNRWKPSDEQMKALESATENCAYSEYENCLRELIGQLKKLKS